MNKKIKTRAFVIFIFVLGAYGIILARLYNVQIINHDKYKLAAIRRHNKPIKVKAERGTIYDRNGEVLAYSKNVGDFEVYTPKLKEKNKKRIAGFLAKFFDKDSLYYYNLMNSGKKNLTLEKNVPTFKALPIINSVVLGLSFNEKFPRKYPYGEVAAHVLGFVNRNNVAVTGVEKEYDKYLKGKAGFILMKRDAMGRMVSIDEERSIMPEKGANVYLTIDLTFQKILEKVLSDGVKTFKGKSAVGIIEDPNTGEIVAMASIPNYDPNNYNLFKTSALKNIAISNAYEPGSTMKSIFMSVLLNEGKVSANERINTENGSYLFMGRRISDTHKYENLTVREVLEHSSNIGMAKLSLRIDSKTIFKYLRNFGFGIKTGIDLPGEIRGRLLPVKQLTTMNKSAVSRGYAISVTGIQLTNAYSALVNGGILFTPFVVKKVVKNDETIVNNEPEEIRQVINSQTSSVIKTWLIGVVENGTAKAARFEDMYVGGKTGTAEVLVNGKYERNEYYTSFVGYFPAESPKYVCYIWVERPQKAKAGGLVAAPIFKKVVSEIIKSHPEIIPEDAKIKREKTGYEKLYADLKNGTKVNKILVSSDVNNRRTHTKRFKTQTFNKSVMPELRGMSKREAIAVLNSLGIQYVFSGHGKIKRQSIKPGTKINQNTKVKLICSK